MKTLLTAILLFAGIVTFAQTIRSEKIPSPVKVAFSQNARGKFLHAVKN